MPSGTSRYYALEGQVHTTRSTRGFDYSKEIEYEKKDFTVYICFIVVFNCLQ